MYDQQALLGKMSDSDVGAALAAIIVATKGYPFEVALPNDSVNGVILADQIRGLDWTARRAERISSVADEILAEVLAKLSTLM